MYLLLIFELVRDKKCQAGGLQDFLEVIQMKFLLKRYAENLWRKKLKRWEVFFACLKGGLKIGCAERSKRDHPQR